MQDDAPAALPLLAFVTGLLFATNAIAFATMALLTWRFHRRLAIALAFLALGALRASSMANAPGDDNRSLRHNRSADRKRLEHTRSRTRAPVDAFLDRHRTLRRAAQHLRAIRTAADQLGAIHRRRRNSASA